MCVSTYKPAARPQDQPTLTTYNTAQDRDETFVSDGTICGPNMVISYENAIIIFV